MLASILLPVVLALGAVASPTHHAVRRAVDGIVHSHLQARQGFTADILPSQCTDQCQGTLTIYNACTANDQTTCLTVCNSDTFNEFVGCFKCVIDNTPNFPSAGTSALQSTINDLEQACAMAGTTPSVTVSLGAVSGSASASGPAVSATGTGLVTVPGSGASATPSAASGIGASASSAAGAIGSAASSASGNAASSAGNAASSASSAAASPSGAADRVIPVTGWLAAIGVAAGVLAL